MASDEILLRKEFNRLSDTEKVAYFQNHSTWFVDLIDRCDPGDYGLPELITAFCRSAYSQTLDTLIDQVDESAYTDFEKQWDSLLLETMKVNRVKNDEVILFIANEIYEDDMIYKRLRDSRHRKHANPTADKAEPLILFAYHPNMNTGYIGSPDIGLAKGKERSAKELRSIILYNTEEIKRQILGANETMLMKRARFWKDTSACSEVMSVPGYSDLCKCIATFFSSGDCDVDALKDSFENLGHLEGPYDVFKDFQKRLSQSPD